jgi:hypothetical protein
MPIFEFSSPEGVKYYGEGASPEEAFHTAEEREPNEIAAMRQRQAVHPSGGRGESGFTGALEDTLVPGLGAVKSAMGGEFSEAAGEAAMSALPFGAGRLGPAAKAAGAGAATLFAPSATAGGMFDAEPDPVKRRALERQYKEGTPRSQRELLAQFNAAQGKVAEEQRAAARETEARGQTQKQRQDWLTSNAEAIKGLKPEWQQQINAAGSLPEAQAMFDRGVEARRQAGMTISERYPEGVLALEGLGVAGSAALPAMSQVGKTKAISRAATAAERDYAAAYGPGSRASKGRAAAAEMSGNVLREQSKRPIWDPLDIGIDPREMAIGTAIPYAMGTFGPNIVDVMMGRLSDDPAAKEKADRAWARIADPEAAERALLEGLLFSVAGGGGGAVASHRGSERARAKGITDTYDSRNAAIKAEEDKRAATAAKRAATRAAKESEPPAANRTAIINMPSPAELAGSGIPEPPPLNPNTPPRAPRKPRNPMKRSDLDPLAAGYGDPLA